MRCVCCDKILSDFEATRKHIETEQYLDMCNKCLSFCPEIPYTERADLAKSDENFNEDELAYEDDDGQGYTEDSLS